MKTKEGVLMKYKGSIIASEIVNEWTREKELKKMYERRKEIEKKKEKPVSSAKPLNLQRDI